MPITSDQQRVIKAIKSDLDLAEVLKVSDSLPAAFKGKQRIRAIVLGADPSAPNSRNHFETVFDIGGKDKRYFAGIERNLKAVGLDLDEVYVQNVVQNYCSFETDKNNVWQKLAEYWLPLLEQELREFDPAVPVLITAGKVYSFLVPVDAKPDFSKYYNEPGYIPPEANRLGRKLFPFFRNFRYVLDNWASYRDFIKQELNSNG